jgi:isopenicillin N synthase-like dioxygenase
VRDHIPKDKGIWEPIGVDGFQESVLTYWAACLATARHLIRLIALALDLPEDYFDQFTTYPGGDFALTFYPGHGEAPIENPDEVGVGAHTDLQILTLLWQDQNKGLQVLNSQNEWIIAPPIPGTLVVNIGDFLMRLTNDRLKSTVHRVVQHNKDDRYSMPFFFGFNFDEKLGVLPTCASEENPPKYQPATCGEVCQLSWGYLIFACTPDTLTRYM